MLEKKVNKMNVSLKREYFSSNISENEGNLKETWRTINKLFNKRSKTTKISSLKVDGQEITDTQQISNSINDFFCNIGEELSEKIPNHTNPLLDGQYNVNPSNAAFKFRPIVPGEIIRDMNTFKTSNGSGLDGISSFFLKLAMPVVANSLSILFNKSIEHGVFLIAGKLPELVLFTRLVQLMRGPTIGLYLCYRLFLDYLKS